MTTPEPGPRAKAAAETADDRAAAACPPPNASSGSRMRELAFCRSMAAAMPPKLRRSPYPPLAAPLRCCWSRRVWPGGRTRIMRTTACPAASPAVAVPGRARRRRSPRPRDQPSPDPGPRPSGPPTPAQGTDALACGRRWQRRRPWGQLSSSTSGFGPAVAITFCRWSMKAPVAG